MFGTPRTGLRAARLHRRGLAAVALATFLLLQPFGSIVQAIPINTLNTAITQNFDTLASNPTASTVTTAWADDSTLPGWYAQVESPPTNPTTYRADSGGTTTGAIYSFGSVGSSERAFGSIGSGTPDDIFWAIKLENNTGVTISSLTVNYTGEQWRDGGTPTTGSVAQTVDFQYQVGAPGTITDANSPTSGWIDFNPLDFTSPTFGATTGTALNGNLAANRTVKSASFAIPPVAPGNEIWLRWWDRDHPSNDHGLAIDDFSVSALGTFSTDGMLTEDVSAVASSPELDDAAFAVGIQSTGKIVAGGYVEQLGEPNHKDFTLSRYNYDGTPDATFGPTTVDFGPNQDDRIYGLAIEPGDTIIAAGSTFDFDATPPSHDVAVVRYPANGGAPTMQAFLSTTNGGGAVDEQAFAVAIQSDGRIVVAGTTNTNGDYDFLVARFNADGTLDDGGGSDTTVGDSFGAAGVAVIDVADNNGEDVAHAVVIQPDGKIVVAGSYKGASAVGTSDFAVVRLNPQGTLDTSFDTDGKTTTDIATRSDEAFGVALQTDGDIVVVGSANIPSGSKDFALVRYNGTDGSLDATFDTDGKVTTDQAFGADVARSVLVQPDGKIVVAGHARNQHDDFALARYNTDGSLDTTFDDDGKVITVFSSNKDDRAYDVALQADGKLVAAGYATNPLSPTPVRDFALARYLPDGSPDAEVNGAPVLQPNLVLEKSDSVHTPLVGTDFTYTITVKNTGPGDATNVVITDVLPSQVTFATETHSHGFVIASTTVTNNVGTLRRGETATLNIGVTANVARLISNTASVTSDETDVNSSDNSDTEMTRIIGINNMTFSPSTVVGGCENSTGTVFLSGPAPTGGVTVNLSSNNAAASVPSTVFIPAGATSETFTVTTSPVATTQQPTIRAEAGTSVFTRRLTVTPGPCPP